MANFFFLLIGILMSGSFAHAKAVTVEKKLSATIESPRWMYDANQKPKKPISLKLMQMKKAQLEKKWERCFLDGERLKKEASTLRSWIEWNQMQCLNQWGGVSRKARQSLNTLLNSVESRADGFAVRNQRVLLAPFLEGHFLILKFETPAVRASAWKRIEKIQKYQSDLSREQLAELYFRAGELAFVEQRLAAALDFFKRSRKIKERPEIAEKLASILKTSPQLAEAEGLTAPGAVADAKLKFQDEELKIVERMKRALSTKDLVSSVEDGVELIQKYPGSDHANWAEEQILSVYLGVVDQSDERFQLYREKIVKLMKSADASRLHRWARNAWARGAFKDAVLLADQALEKMGSHPEERKILLLAANSAVSSGQYSAAEEAFKRLVNRHGGSSEALEAHFRLGLLYFRQKKYSQSAFHFEKILAVADDSDFHSSSMYWRWRNYQKMNHDGTAQAAVELVQKYPVTYYGLRAALEAGGGKLQWQESQATAETKMPGYLPQGEIKAALSFTATEAASLDRVELLTSAGWYEEAQMELTFWPEPTSAQQKVLYAKYYAEAFQYVKAITLLNEAWTENPQLRTRESVLLGFPFEFTRAIDTNAKQYQLSPHLVRGLIRQESSFKPDALSPSNAHGLMQIVPVTARDIAKNLNWKKPLNLPQDLFAPEQNVQFGSSYFARLNRAFNGHVPLALAAYNAGIGRVRKWMAARPDLGVDDKTLDSSPESEIWIDELPWDETRQYVKGVLRNYFMYRLIADKELSVQNPVWKNVESQ